MNILFVSNYYPSRENPQFCIFIQQQAEALIRLGHNVDVIVPVGVCHRKEKITHEIIAGIPIYYAEYFTLYKNIYSVIALQRNIRVLENLFDFSKYNIVSIQMFDEFTLRIFLNISNKHHIKSTVHYHGLSILYDHPLPLEIRILQHRGDKVLKKLLHKADAIVGVSNKVCARVIKSVGMDNVYTVYNGVNPDLFQPSIIKYDDYTIVSVASLKKIKGNHYLIDAVKMFLEKHKDQTIKLILIGHGPEQEALTALIRERNMEDIVQMIGYIAYEEVAQIVTQCDVFVMPSYYEALGCAYLEAMACRLPVIGCRYQGIDEIIQDGINGFLVNPHDIYQIFERLDYLYEHPEIAEDIAQNGYDTVIENYTWLHSASRLLEVYNMILGT